MNSPPHRAGPTPSNWQADVDWDTFVSDFDSGRATTGRGASTPRPSPSSRSGGNSGSKKAPTASRAKGGTASSTALRGRVSSDDANLKGMQEEMLQVIMDMFSTDQPGGSKPSRSKGRGR